MVGIKQIIRHRLTREHGPVNGGGVVADSVLAAKEHSRRVLHHIVFRLARVPRDNRRGQDVVVIARGT